MLEAGHEHPETLVLTHAGGGHVETYARNIVPLGKSVHAVGVEMLWHGLSDGPPIQEDRIAQEGEQVVDVMDAMGVEKAWVASHGSGGVVLTWGNFRLSYTRVYVSPQARGSESHQFGAVSLSWRMAF